ncbi:MAG: ornithine carbamoyltransferase [Deltaproteobacteria bacterium]|nr:ornithine carbamoyltransferase [Deltaproteobacteria bacterium]
MKKDLLILSDLEKDDFERLFKRALELKERHKMGITDRPFAGKTLGLIFSKPSTRTRISFETAMVQLGGTPIFISTKDTQIARNEPVKDTARVLSRYMDCLAIRTFSQDLLVEYSKFSDIPIINALTDVYHPCQVLSDLLTVIEYKNGYEGVKVAWVGDGNNVAHSWINASAVLGFELVLACPESYSPDSIIMKKALEKSGSNIKLIHDPVEAVHDADVIYTDVWASMGQEDREFNEIKQVFEPFQVNKALLSHAPEDVIVMHCLPAHRDEEITEEVMEGPRSVVWDQAENKMHMHKAILDLLISKEKKA